MRLDLFCEIMGFDGDAGHILEPLWKPALTAYPGAAEFFSESFIRRYFPLIKADEKLLEPLLETAAIARAVPAATLYGWCLYYTLFLAAERGEITRMPLPQKVFGDQAGLFQLLVAMAALPLIEKKFSELGLPEHYARDIAPWLGGTVQLYEAGHDGLPGHNLSQSFWIRHYVDGRLFRIGRFEYLIHPQPEWSPAVYVRRDGAPGVRALCRDGWYIDAEGYRCQSGEGGECRLVIRDGQVCGTPISPLGHALHGETLELDLREWEPAVSPWEWVPSIHIPAGGGMSPELALESMRQAKRFFRQYFDRDIAMFVCGSWIFNPDWELELPDSNLARVMRMLFLAPCYPGAGRDGLFFIFGRDKDADWSHYPADNSVRRAFHRLREKGRRLKSGGMFVLTRDLEQLNDGFYRASDSMAADQRR